LIPVILKTPVNIIPIWWNMLHQMLLRFFQDHVFLQKLLNLIS
jgi:hypothetical protein